MIASISRYGKLAIEVLQDQIAQLGFTPYVHFELEGGYIPQPAMHKKGNAPLDYDTINQALAEISIQGRLKPEYWRHQWEYFSSFEGQTPLKVATDLAWVIQNLPIILKQNGAKEVYIKPVVWGGDRGRLAPDCDNIFSAATELVHVPNAVQMNISAVDARHDNVIPRQGMGEYLQFRLLRTSCECSLLYLPEPEAFERLQLKDRFGLSRELSSPNDLSGGHQGSVALYREKGKHNQLMGEEPLLYDSKHSVIATKQNWRPLSRIEHRLGASSLLFNPYAAAAFALANLSDALIAISTSRNESDTTRLPPDKLPTSLFGRGNDLGAFELFEQGMWLNNKINQCVADTRNKSEKTIPDDLGDLLKQAVLALYKKRILTTARSGLRV